MAEALAKEAEETTIPEKGVVEESAEETKEEAESTEEELESQAEAEKAMEAHKESSKLGRKMADMDKRLNDFMERQTQMMETMSSANTAPVAIDPDETMTVGTYNMLKQQEALETENARIKQQNFNNKYAREYESEINNIGDTVDDDDLHMQILKLTTDPNGGKYNVQSSADPTAAAQINYNKAMRDVLKGDVGKKASNLKHDKRLPPKGGKTT